MTFFLKDDKIIGVYRYGWKAFGKMKEETTCLLGVAGSVNASVHVLVKWKKGESPAPEPVIKGKKTCLLDGEKRRVHGKARGDSWEMEMSKGKSAWSNMTLIQLNAPWRRKNIPDSDGWNCQEKANNTQCDHGHVKDTIKEMVIIPGG